MLFHCPNCHHLIKAGTQFCPHCGYHIQYAHANYQIRHYPMPPKRHHYIEWLIIVILLIIIGVGGYYMLNSSPNFSASHQNNQNNVTHTIHTVTKHVTHKIHNISSKKSNSKPKLVNKSGYTLSVLPANIQGTWYSYDGGKLSTLIIRPTSVTVDGHTSPVRAMLKSKAPANSNHHRNWSYALPVTCRGLHYSELRGWDQTAGDGVSYATFNTNGMTVLDEAGGADFWTDGNYYKTKALAKQYKKHIFKNVGEKGYPD